MAPPKLSAKLAEGHTIDDGIVQDTVSALSGFGMQSIITGGMAVQAYLPPEYRRVSTDLDLSTKGPLSQDRFKMCVAPVEEALRSLGYQTQVKPASRERLDLQISNSNDSFLVQAAKRSPNSYEKHRARLEREIANAFSKPIGRTEAKILRPEDLILRKLRRVLMFESDYGISPIPKGTIQEQFEAIKVYRDHVLANIDSLQFSDISRLRMAADLYDITVLLAHQPFDQMYFREGAALLHFPDGDKRKRFGSICIAIDPRLAEL